MRYEQTFENFVVSATNEIPVIVVKSILTKDGPNRILLYGTSGSGKTHLIQALSHAAKSAWPPVSCENFTGYTLVQEYVRSIQENRSKDFSDQLRSVFERLTTLLPDKVTVSSEDLVADVSVIADPVTPIDKDVWSVPREGLYQQRTIAIHYKAPGEWYLLCWSHHDEEVRIYALFRIKKARRRKKTFTRPEGFSVDTYIDPPFGVFVNEGAANIAVRFDGDNHD